MKSVEFAKACVKGKMMAKGKPYSLGVMTGLYPAIIS